MWQQEVAAIPPASACRFDADFSKVHIQVGLFCTAFTVLRQPLYMEQAERVLATKPVSLLTMPHTIFE